MLDASCLLLSYRLASPESRQVRLFFVDDITEQTDYVYRKAILTSLFKYDGLSLR